MALVGATVESGRIWDIMTIAGRYSDNGSRWRVAGYRSDGILAAYAALFQPAIESVVVLGPPSSHRPGSDGKYGPPLLNVLRVLDIPEALGCLAPRPLTLVGAIDRAFDRTAEIYRIANASVQLVRK